MKKYLAKKFGLLLSNQPLLLRFSKKAADVKYLTIVVVDFSVGLEFILFNFLSIFIVRLLELRPCKVIDLIHKSFQQTDFGKDVKKSFDFLNRLANYHRIRFF